MVLKALPLIFGVVLVGNFVSLEVQPARAGSSTAQTALDPLRLCPLHNLSGYSAIDATGSLINLKQYCQLQQARMQSSHAPFWQAFVAAAAPAAIVYARSLDQDAILAYSDTICPFLESGGTVSQLRQIQASGTLPGEFEVAVTIAAIQTQCPTYQADLGR